MTAATHPFPPPTPAELPFLTAMRCSPNSNEPRLAYADWFDQRGDHLRADLIRLQCRLADCEGCRGRGVCVRCPPPAVESKLLKSLAATFGFSRKVAVLPLRRRSAESLGPRVVWYERGFPQAIRWRTNALLAWLPDLLRVAPTLDDVTAAGMRPHRGGTPLNPIYCWVPGHPARRSPECVPPAAFGFLPTLPIPDTVGRRGGWPSESSAIDAAEDAILEYGRRIAWPELYPGEPVPPPWMPNA